MNPTTSTTEYDVAFGKIQKLTWLPWVGSNLPQRPFNKRLLVVGESHYYGDTQDQIEAADNQLYTRWVVEESLVNGEWSTPTLSAIPKLLLGSAEYSRVRLWSDTAFYNFVQRPMHYPDRPNGDDFAGGWKVFSEVVKIIQPSHCLFIGVTAANYFDDSMNNQHCSFVHITYPQRIGRIWGRKAAVEFEGRTTELGFVKHAGMYFSRADWHDYLQTNHSVLMNWLQAESYVAGQQR